MKKAGQTVQYRNGRAGKVERWGGVAGVSDPIVEKPDKYSTARSRALVIDHVDSMSL